MHVHVYMYGILVHTYVQLNVTETNLGDLYNFIICSQYQKFFSSCYDLGSLNKPLNDVMYGCCVCGWLDMFASYVQSMKLSQSPPDASSYIAPPSAMSPTVVSTPS